MPINAAASGNPELRPSPPAQSGALGKWFKALRAYSFTASMVPVAAGALLAAGQAGARWGLLPFVALGVLFLHIGTNLINDYYDYELGLDHQGALGGSGVLVSGDLTAKQVGLAGLASFILAAVLGIPLVLARGWPILALGALGAAGGALYTAKPVQYKYFGAGDALVFLLMGPLMVGGAQYALSGRWSTAAWAASLPIGLLVTAILHANNLRDLELDAEFDLKTLAIRLGRRGSLVYLNCLLAGAFLATIGAALLGFLPWPALLALLAAPLALKLSKGAQGKSADIVEQAAQLHLSFGLLLSVGLGAALFL